VGLIYGDSCHYPVINGILQGLKNKGFASSNITFGVGSFSMNYATRDSLGMAQKATWAQVAGKGHNLFKDPKTDTGLKKSAKGLIRVDLVDGIYTYTDCVTPEQEQGGELKTVFLNGKLLIDQTLAEIRARVLA
jgi:nicotinamide phosphoribosyltransferase